MKRVLPFLTVVLVLVPFISACGLAPATSPAPTGTPPDVAPATPHQVTPLPGDPDDIVPQPIPLPVAVLVDTRDGLGLTLFGRDGLALGEWAISPPVPGTGHVAASAADGVDQAPLVFFGGSEDPGATFLKVSLGGNTSTRFEIPRQASLYGLMGVPGQPFIAFSTIEPLSEGAVIRSRLYVGDYNIISLDAPALVVDSAESRIVVPVAIRMGLESLQGFWYTYSMWGIGGDMFTEPRTGLYYFNLETGISSEYLTLYQTFSSLSISQTLAVWTASPTAPLSITDLVTGSTVTFPLLPDGERSAVHGLISPAEGFVAWMEGRGWLYDGNLEATIRIGTTGGILLADYPASRFAKPSGLGEDLLIYPVGWLNDEILLVATYAETTEQGALVLLNANTGELSSFRSGFFAGFAYP